MMTEEQFKATYVAQFLASYMAGRYDQDCQMGHPNRPYDHQPVEDAVFLAKCAWTQIVAQTEKSQSPEVSTLFELAPLP